MSHYTITIGFEADNQAEAEEITKEIMKQVGTVIVSFDRYAGDEEDQDTNAVKEYSPEDRTDRITKIIDIYNPNE